MDMYQFQADEADKQQALLDLIGLMLDVWTPKVHHVVWGGDFNASLRARTGYAQGAHGQPTPQEAADARLATWLRARPTLQHSIPDGATWTSPIRQQEATLDFFISMGLGQPACTVEDSLDIRHDHRVIRMLLDVSTISPLPHHWDIYKPKRLRMTEWKQKREKWAEDTAQMIASLPSDTDPLSHLVKAEIAAKTAAARVLGTSGGRRNTLIPFHSERFKKLTAQLRIAKAARKDIALRCQATILAPPSKAMRAAWDRGMVPDGVKVKFNSLAMPPYAAEVQSWAKEWLATLREHTTLFSKQLHDLRLLCVFF